MSNTIEVERESTEAQEEVAGIEDYDIQLKLHRAEHMFAEEFAEATMKHRYNQLTDTVRTDLTTATILGAETVRPDSVTLRVEREGTEQHMTFYTEDSYRTPTMEDLFSVVGVQHFHGLEDEELTVLPFDRHEVGNCSSLSQRFARKLRILSIRMGIGGVATAEHPFTNKYDVTTTPQGTAILWGVTVLSGVGFGLLANSLVLGSTLLTVASLLLLTVVFSASAILASLSTLVAAQYVLFG